ncbi:hypothetical protein [Acinetobacter nosocomialis]|uniref:hypothetical protein n=1 Tax=Acinetobacter nosocomialis TaxID=106654 RepID=UPI00244AD73B|nr:hypothetical protein [Acinetobacter nosocomialis]MDH2592533.1 hypothetical protein [Acinetobacter nosocomialis]
MTFIIKRRFSYLALAAIPVTAAWLMGRYSLSRKLIIDELRPFNKGTDGKHLYDPNEVIPILENLNIQRQQQSRRKN